MLSVQYLIFSALITVCDTIQKTQTVYQRPLIKYGVRFSYQHK